MNKELQIFKKEEFGQVRMVVIKGKPYAVGIDIAKALGYKDPNSAITRHCRGWVKRSVTDNLGREQQMNVIPEWDIYRLAANSELPSAEEFESWVFDEILPEIRETGGYVNSDDLFINTYLPFVDNQTKALFKSTLEIVKKQNVVIQTLQPKANYFDDLVDRNLLTNFRDTAKELKIKQKDFIEWLETNKYIYRDNKDKIKPYREHVPSLFELKEFVTKGGYADTQTLITPRGRETFRLLLKKEVA